MLTEFLVTKTLLLDSNASRPGSKHTICQKNFSEIESLILIEQTDFEPKERVATILCRWGYLCSYWWCSSMGKFTGRRVYSLHPLAL